ncbi:aspartate carbamoyltransferase [Herbidospora galbida]|uniref:Aspartate carbamoyltransferase n=2 Tax=Herbidospora galbida TaxID=2575442 RepID=A0A4U3M8Y7_9ACTN|nr:aspartate carbamoyltransferase [Herbidospora galbida]
MAVLALVAAAATVYVSLDRQTDRHAEIEAKSRQVMPFDLESTTHRSAKSAFGGVQTVTSDDPQDTEEAARFTTGDYGDPASIHGGEMPGLNHLEQGHAELADPSLITALHAWFDAQVSDHGRHAEHG